jgi:hypothetical protein
VERDRSGLACGYVDLLGIKILDRRALRVGAGRQIGLGLERKGG